jgi:HAD superfamily hydrolase (TIGR01450 family)
MTWALDLDGVVWLAGRALPGSAEAVELLRGAGERVVFLTNNSGPLVADHLSALARIGIEAQGEDLTTSAQAAASTLQAGERVSVVGEGGVLEALAGSGVEVVPADAKPQAVVVGRTLQLDYLALSAAAEAIRGGARFVATNTDATFPTGNGLQPGAGALVAFLSVASGREPLVAGKPHEAMASLVRARYGAVSVMAGDRPDTDGRFAGALGARFALVLSGVTRPSDLPVEPEPDLVGPDLAAVVNGYLSSSRR